MKTPISVILLILLAALLAGCAGGQQDQTAHTPAPAAPSAAISPAGANTADPSAAPMAEPTPTPTPAATPTPTPTATLTPTPTATPEPYDYASPVPASDPVDDAWFADALFIGDSRTDGLRLYSGLRAAGCLSNKGLTVFEVISDKEVLQTPAGRLGVLTALGQEQYAKIYVCLGLNELGYNYDQGFHEAYSQMVSDLKELQPEADIYLQAIIPVSTEVCKATHQADYVNNEQIAVYNNIIRAVAEDQQVYFLNVGEAMVDETGELPADASADGIHFHKEGYQLWYDYLKTHTVEEDRP